MSSIAIIGGGPRGISLVERLGAAGVQADIHLIDEHEPGAGAVWRTDQTRLLCMNTLADAVTMFTEPGATVTAPVRPGPTLYEWGLLVLQQADRALSPAAAAGLPGRSEDPTAGIPDDHRAPFAAHPPAPEAVAGFLDELAVTRPESNPSRALYGEYLQWVLGVVGEWLPQGSRLELHHARAEHISDTGRVELSTGATINADAVVLTGGWLAHALTPAEQSIEQAVVEVRGAEDEAGTVGNKTSPQWIRPGNPLEQDLTVIAPEETVLVRGLGMGFFDAMALLTEGRGGSFVPAEGEDAAGLLRYRASGREPRILATSHRGYPFLPKSEYGGLPPAAHLPRARAAAAALGERTSAAEAAGRNIRGSIDFDTQLWPAIVRDAFEAHALTLYPDSAGSIAAAVDGADIDPESGGPADDFATVRAALADIVGADQAFHPEHFVQSVNARLAGRLPLADAAAFTRWAAESITEDLRAAQLAAASPQKNGLWSFSAARRLATLTGNRDRFSVESRSRRFRTLHSLGSMVGSGPPAFRTRELFALINAGIVELAGAEPELTLPSIEHPEFTLRTPTVAAATNGRVLLDAWMHAPDIRFPGDPLIAELVREGRLRPFPHHTSEGEEVASPAPDVQLSTNRAINRDGDSDPVLYLAGLPLEDVFGDTTISPMPGSDPSMLRETDRIALAITKSLRGSVATGGAEADRAATDHAATSL